MIINYGYKMKLLNNTIIFFKVLILIFSLQSWTKADDIRDFQIEGISIGDSALDYFSENEILKNTNESTQFPNSNKFKRAEIEGIYKNYDGLIINYKNNDKTYKVQSISGIKFYRNTIIECYERMDQIKSEISKIFNTANFRSTEKKHRGDLSGQSIVKSYYYDLKNGDGAGIQCYDWSKKMKFSDHLRIRISNNDFRNFLLNEAY